MLFYILTYRFYYLLRQSRRAPPALLAEVEQMYEKEKRSKRFHTTMSSNEEIDYQNCIWVKVLVSNATTNLLFYYMQPVIIFFSAYLKPFVDGLKPLK